MSNQDKNPNRNPNDRQPWKGGQDKNKQNKFPGQQNPGQNRPEQTRNPRDQHHQ